jgi:alpha-N-arabinofuranosidase
MARERITGRSEAVIYPDTEIGKIRPELHGHFAEHLGSCIYGGLWVGKNSPIPNVDGYRRTAIDYLKKLGIPVLRWPGGCFADDYHWRDGIGDPVHRPRTVNIWWGNDTEDNSFGTHEFIGLCRTLGAEPYIAGNIGSGTPRELRDWMEYCNFPSGSTLSEERAANGSPLPFNVRCWGAGNENWGCGGHMTAEEYAAHYRRFRCYMKKFGEAAPFVIACGPDGHNLDWTRRFFSNVPECRQPDGYAMHFYSTGSLYAAMFDADAMLEQFATFRRMESAIREQRALIDCYDPARRVGLMVDEWGAWDRADPSEEETYGKLWQQITMRSAVAAALGLNVFHRQADKLIMCNIAQIVNVIHALLLTDRGDRCVRTPVYWAFDLLKDHRGKTSVAVAADEAGPHGLSISASRERENLVLTFVNPGHDAGVSVECSLIGYSVGSVRARILHDPDFNACNTFENPDRLIPQSHLVEAHEHRISVNLPALAIVTVEALLSA